MKKFFSILITILILIMLSLFYAEAEDTQSFDMSGVYDSLSDSVKQSMNNVGIKDASAGGLSDLSFEAILSEIASIASQCSASSLKGLISIFGVLLLSSVLTAYKNTLSNDVSNAVNIVSSLCLVSAVAFPAVSVINGISSLIEVSANLMFAYIPIMVAILSASSKPVSSATSSAVLIATGEGVGQLSSKVIIPFMNIFLGISITSSVTPNINLSGFTAIISKIVKWLLGFSMALFSAFLAFKQVISNSLDTVSGRAMKFMITSFVPVVGSALSDAYRTVQGSLTALKSGLGIFVIIAVIFVFLPSILQCLLWLFALWIGKATADVLNLSQPSTLLQNISTVFSTILAILLCLMSVYIISSTLMFMLGGGTG